jgi:capsule polysaccharide export protein KpsE/RkpR
MSLISSKPNSLRDQLSLQEMPLQDQRARQADQLRLLWDHRRLLFRSTAIGLLFSALFAFMLPKSYTSTAQLMPPESQSSSGLAIMATLAAKGAGGLGSMAADLFGLNSTGALFIGILRSDAAQSRLVEQFALKKVYGTRLDQDARTALDEHTVISEDRKSGIISISVTDRSPERAAALTRAYVDQLNALISELSTSSAHRERVFLEERLTVAKHDLDDAANGLAQFSSQSGTVDLQTMGKAALDAAGTLAGELIVAQSELEGLRQIYSDSNPRVRSLNARVGELRKDLEKLGGANTPAESDPSGGTTSGSQADRLLDMPYPSLRSLPLLGVKYADYYRRAKIQETVYELLTQQYELAKIQEAKETPSVKVLDRPKVAEKKSSPPRFLLTLLGGFLVFCAAIAWVVGSATWHASDPRDPRRILVRDVAATVKAKFPWASRNGDGGTSSSDTDISHG